MRQFYCFYQVKKEIVRSLTVCSMFLLPLFAVAQAGDSSIFLIEETFYSNSASLYFQGNLVHIQDRGRFHVVGDTVSLYSDNYAFTTDTPFNGGGHVFMQKYDSSDISVDGGKSTLDNIHWLLQVSGKLSALKNRSADLSFTEKASLSFSVPKIHFSLSDHNIRFREDASILNYQEDRFFVTDGLGSLFFGSPTSLKSYVFPIGYDKAPDKYLPARLRWGGRAEVGLRVTPPKPGELSRLRHVQAVWRYTTDKSVLLDSVYLQHDISLQSPTYKQDSAEVLHFDGRNWICEAPNTVISEAPTKGRITSGAPIGNSREQYRIKKNIQLSPKSNGFLHKATRLPPPVNFVPQDNLSLAIKTICDTLFRASSNVSHASGCNIVDTGYYFLEAPDASWVSNGDTVVSSDLGKVYFRVRNECGDVYYDSLQVFVRVEFIECTKPPFAVADMAYFHFNSPSPTPTFGDVALNDVFPERYKKKTVKWLDQLEGLSTASDGSYVFQPKKAGLYEVRYEVRAVRLDNSVSRTDTGLLVLNSYTYSPWKNNPPLARPVFLYGESKEELVVNFADYVDELDGEVFYVADEGGNTLINNQQKISIPDNLTSTIRKTYTATDATGETTIFPVVIKPKREATPYVSHSLDRLLVYNEEERKTYTLLKGNSSELHLPSQARDVATWTDLKQGTFEYGVDAPYSENFSYSVDHESNKLVGNVQLITHHINHPPEQAGQIDVQSHCFNLEKSYALSDLLSINDQDLYVPKAEEHLTYSLLSPNEKVSVDDKGVLSVKRLKGEGINLDIEIKVEDAGYKDRKYTTVAKLSLHNSLLEFGPDCACDVKIDRMTERKAGKILMKTTNIGCFPYNILRVVNRWGLLVYQEENVTDGNIDLQGKLPPGVYYWFFHSTKGTYESSNWVLVSE